MHDHGLVGVEGARKVLARCIEAADDIEEMSLGHNDLGDEGCIELFDGLKSLRDDGGKLRRLRKITLSSNHIGNEALTAIAGYVRGDQVLEELYLPHNSLCVSNGKAALCVRGLTLGACSHPRACDPLAAPLHRRS